MLCRNMHIQIKNGIMVILDSICFDHFTMQVYITMIVLHASHIP